MATYLRNKYFALKPSIKENRVFSCVRFLSLDPLPNCQYVRIIGSERVVCSACSKPWQSPLFKVRLAAMLIDGRLIQSAAAAPSTAERYWCSHNIYNVAAVAGTPHSIRPVTSAARRMRTTEGLKSCSSICCYYYYSGSQKGTSSGHWSAGRPRKLLLWSLQDDLLLPLVGNNLAFRIWLMSS